MAKKVKAIVKLAIPAGKATPAPPVGPALGQHGINIMAFCKDYNARTAHMAGSIIPAEITVFQDNSFRFVLKTPPATDLLKKAAGIASGSKSPNKEKVGKVTEKQVMDIVKLKKNDLIGKNILDNQYNRYVQYLNTWLILLFKYIIGVIIVFITRQLNHQDIG